MSPLNLATVMGLRRTRLRPHLATPFSLVMACLLSFGCGPVLPEHGGASTSDVADPWSPDVDELPSEFPLTVGHYWPAGAAFTPLMDAQDMEIVQGIQGGVHTEIAFELDLGFDYASTQIVYFDVHVQTLLDGEEVVAETVLANYKAGNIGFGVFQSQTVPVIFEQNQAEHYVDHQALIVAQLTFDGEVSGQAISVQLIDTGNEVRSR